MNPIEYIQSGILELYVQGTATPQERQEVECMSHIYPEIKEELSKLEQSMEKYVQIHAVSPPAHLRSKILTNARKTILENKPTLETSSENVSQPETKVVKLTPTWIKAASAAASVAAIVFGIQNWNNARKVEVLSQDLLASNTNSIRMESELKEKAALLELSLAPTTNKIDLSTVKATAPDAMVSIIWDTKSDDVLLRVHNLPQAPAGKQYQLWAIVAGVPVDLGMLDSNATSTDIQNMKKVKEPQAFAITLEIEGGVPSPTLEEMYVLGNVPTKQ